MPAANSPRMALECWRVLLSGFRLLSSWNMSKSLKKTVRMSGPRGSLAKENKHIWNFPFFTHQVWTRIWVCIYLPSKSPPAKIDYQNITKSFADWIGSSKDDPAAPHMPFHWRRSGLPLGFRCLVTFHEVSHSRQPLLSAAINIYAITAKDMGNFGVRQVREKISCLARSPMSMDRRQIALTTNWGNFVSSKP